MRILVTGGTGVIGEGAIPELIARGHQIRLFSRHAEEDARQWPGTEPTAGSVTDDESLRGVAGGCDAVLHIAGIAQEDPPDVTFAAVNVEGTRLVIEEAERAGAGRFVFVSSLGADIGDSDYHRSKRAAEELVRASGLRWTIVRPGNVYGPGDEVISTILKMVRTLPAVPVIDGGEHAFQPVWHEDLAKILAATIERDDLDGKTLEAVGPDTTTTNDLLTRFARITGREPARIPLPMALAQLAASLSSIIDLPIDENKLTMLKEENVLRGKDASTVLGITTTPLDQGLEALAEAIPEAVPEEGFGSLEHKHFHADVSGSRHSPASLMTLFKERVTDVMPIEFAAEPDAPTRVEKGATMTASMPMRGHVQIRVVIAEPSRVVFATIEGHPLSGIVEFTTTETTSGVRFAVDTYTRASNLFDWIALKTVGAAAQTWNWQTVVQRMVEASGGTSDGVHYEKRTLSDEEAESVEKRVRSMIEARKQDETAEATAVARADEAG
jgi:uncharacterized protein YbjT (DUF2867 family)